MYFVLQDGHSLKSVYFIKAFRLLVINFAPKMFSLNCFVFTSFICFVFCNTGSDIQPSNLERDIILLKKEVVAMQEQMNYDRTARVDLDRDLTEIARRYRELALENVKIKEENLQLRNYVDNRYSTLLSDMKDRKSDYEGASR